MKTKMKITTINIPDNYLASCEALIKLNLYASRSQIVRVALSEFLEKELKFNTDINEKNFIQIRDVRSQMEGLPSK